MRLRIIVFTLILSALSFADDNPTISGFIRDAENGEVLIGANVYLENQAIGTSTNQYGFYSLSLVPGKYTVLFNYVGYSEKKYKLDITSNKTINIELKPEAITTEEIVVTAQKSDENIRSLEMSTITVDPMELRRIPVLFGEQDVLKSIQLLPGVSAGSEGSSGFHVRGGGLDQNLILLDEAPVYNASHLMGFFSVFNSDAINSAKLIKGGGSPEYGGRLSSVFDIKMNEGNRKNLSTSGGIGLISSRLALEGPINEGKGSFIIAGRRTYADVVMKSVNPENFDDLSLYFYDLNMKVNYQLGAKDYLYLSGYLGRDVLGFQSQFGLDWGNTTATLRWSHIFNDKIFSNTSLIYSNFDYAVSMENGGSLTDIRSGIEDYNLKQKFHYFYNPSHQISAGFDINYHTFTPGQISTSGQTNFGDLEIDKKYALESAAFIGHEWKASSQISLNYGLRYSNFTVLGPGSVYQFDEDGNVVSESEFDDNEVVKSYGGFEPRFTANILVDRNSSVKLAYSRNQQYIHLISNSSGGPSMDVWHPSTNIVRPGISDQLSLGYFRNFMDNTYETSFEIYYKDLQNQVDYKNGADLLLNPYVESQLVFGDGYSYGAELFVKKSLGKFTGWLAYTWSRTEREFTDINNGDPYPTIYDRTHDISIAAMYAPNKKWDFSATWVYNTGQAVTYPSGKYLIDGQTVNYYTDRNSYRMPDYHRMDLSVTYNLKKRGRFESSFNLSLYNAYGQKNPYTIYFRENEDNPTITEAVKVYMFTYFPSISYNFKW